MSFRLTVGEGARATILSSSLFMLSTSADFSIDTNNVQ